ncbi:MAG: LemA family protein [Butyrivibrio sp.]|nr:LemA family protein [Butyrivibrio sp.]
MDAQSVTGTVNTTSSLFHLLIPIGSIMLIFLIWYIKTNNALILLKNKVDESLSNIDAACMKRTQSIKQCYAAAATLASHEQKVIIESCQYRAGMTSKEIAELDSNITKAIGAINAVAENNPQIRSTDAFLNLQNVVNETEDTLFAQRRIYNSNVTVYNSRIKMIPTNFVARRQQAIPYEFLTATEEDKKGFDIPLPTL